MKIRTKLNIVDPRKWKEEQQRFIQKYPEARELLEELDNSIEASIEKAYEKAYIEIDTGGLFDGLSKEIREPLEEVIADGLKLVGKLLLDGIKCEMAAAALGVGGDTNKLKYKVVLTGCLQLLELLNRVAEVYPKLLPDELEADELKSVFKFWGSKE